MADEMTDSELQFAVESEHKMVDILSTENAVLAQYLKKEVESKQDAALQDEDDQSKARGKKAQRQREDKKRPAELTLEQRASIAKSEVDSLRKELSRNKEHYESLLEKMKTYLEETDVEMAEVKKEYYEFKRDVIGGEQNFRSGKTASERVIRFLEDKMRDKDSLIEKLTNKNAALTNQTSKLETALQNKEEMGEVLLPIDFDQLKIENQQYNEKIEERNNELLKLKLTTGNITQVLQVSKQKLSSLTSDSNNLRKAMEERDDQLHKIKEELHKLGTECTQAHSTNQRLIQQLKQSRTPHVMEYISQKAKVYELKAGIQTFERKVEIAEMEERRHRKQLKSLGAV